MLATMKRISLTDELAAPSADEKFRKYRELWSMAGKQAVLTDFPLHLDIELSSLCNLKCKNCFQNGLMSGPRGFMEFDLFRKVITEGVARGLCAVKLQVRGESFLHPQLVECIRFAKAAGIMDVQITSNSTIMDEPLAMRLVDSGLDGIIFSFDSHHREVCDELAYQNVEKNIRTFLQVRKSSGRPSPWVRIQASIDEAEPQRYAEIESDIRRRFADADTIAVNRMQNYRYDQDSYPDLSTHHELLPCNYLMQRLVVYWNGEVTVCCMDYNGVFGLGNVNETSIHGIWNSERINLMREKHLTGQRKDIEACGHCQVAIRRVHP